MNKIMKKNRGMAIVIVLAFAIVISIMLFVLVANTGNISSQNKQLISYLQAYYLAHSSIQIAKLQLKLLPKETFDFYNDKKSGNPYINIDSNNQFPLYLTTSLDKSYRYDLYNPSLCDDEVSPFTGSFRVDELKFEGSHNNMKLVQDGYKIKVSARVKDKQEKKLPDLEIDESLIVARFTGI